MTDARRDALSEAATALRIVRAVGVDDPYVAAADELLAVIPRLSRNLVHGDDTAERVSVATLSIPHDVAVVVAGHALEHARYALLVDLGADPGRRWTLIVDTLDVAAAVLRLEALRRATAKLAEHSRRGPRPRKAS